MFKRSSVIFIAFVALVAPIANAYADLYAAIAYSESTGRVGYQFNTYRLEDAEQAALYRCGAYDCNVKVWVRNGCASLARATNGTLGWSWSTSLSIAQSQSLYECSLRGHSCGVLAWACTSGRF